MKFYLVGVAINQILRHIFFLEQVSIHHIRLIFSFSLFYAHLICDVTVGNLDLIYAIFKEKNILNEEARIKKILCCVKRNHGSLRCYNCSLFIVPL